MDLCLVTWWQNTFKTLKAFYLKGHEILFKSTVVNSQTLKHITVHRLSTHTHMSVYTEDEIKQMIQSVAARVHEGVTMTYILSSAHILEYCHTHKWANCTCEDSYILYLCCSLTMLHMIQVRLKHPRDNQWCCAKMCIPWATRTIYFQKLLSIFIMSLNV